MLARTAASGSFSTNPARISRRSRVSPSSRVDNQASRTDGSASAAARFSNSGPSSVAVRAAARRRHRSSDSDHVFATSTAAGASLRARATKASEASHVSSPCTSPSNSVTVPIPV